MFRIHLSLMAVSLLGMGLFLGIPAGWALPDGQPAPTTARVVSLGGAITEIVCALGQESCLVGVDTSSTHPGSMQKLPKVGYQRQVSSEGILALHPTLILAGEEAGPPAALQQIREAGTALVQIPTQNSLDGAKAKIRAVASALGQKVAGERLVVSMEADLEVSRSVIKRNPSSPRVLFLYARGPGTLMISGSGTAADEMIRLAGARNTVTEYTGYKPLTAEAAVAAAPDVILLLSHGLESVGGLDGLFKLPGLALTPAGKSGRVVALDDLYLLGFGPRTGQAVRELSERLQTGSRSQVVSNEK